MTSEVSINCDIPIPDRLMDGFRRQEDDQVASAVRGTVIVSRTHPCNLFLVKGQAEGVVAGHQVLAELRRLSVPVYGIAALERMRSMGLIPESFNGQAIFAWGDVLRDTGDNPVVRWLGRSATGWDWGLGYLGGGWYSANPAACKRS